MTQALAFNPALPEYLAAADGTAVRVALRGTLSVKRRGLLGEENHILGTFSMEPEEEELPA